MTRTEIEQIAERVLFPDLGSKGLSRIVVREDRDDPDDPALYVEAILKPGSEVIGGDLSATMHHRLSRELLQAGENRFPYFLVRYEEELAMGADD